MQYDATGEKEWLTAAELSFRASLSLVGKPISEGEPPTQLLQQPWWKSYGQKGSENSTKPPASVKGTVKQPQAALAKPSASTAPTSKPATNAARKPPSTTANKPAAGRTGKPTTGTAVKQAAVRQPTTGRPAGRGRAQAVATIKPQAVGGKSVATLGDLKAVTKPAETSKQPPTPPKQQPQTTTTPSPTPSSTALNQASHHPKLGLARALAKQNDGKPSEECTRHYQDVIKMSPDVHDAYIELGQMLAHSDPVAAVGVYSQFPFSNPPSFDDAYLHGEIVHLLMASESYDNPRLLSSMVAMGQALGIAVLDRHVSKLEANFKTTLLKQVYAGVHQKSVDDPDLQAFFKFKCWT